MKAYERLLKYAVIRTPSDENSTTTPSSACQFNLARVLVDELKDLGVEDAFVDDKCYVYGHIPATEGYENVTKIGFIAHMDTVSDFCDHDITPVLTPDYDGKDLVLGTSGRTLSTDLFKHLPSLKGRTLITSDGTTVLGSDDKAGVAEIMTMIERLNEEHIPHGAISIGFTPDEEIGEGATNFNVEVFDAEFAYTLDGGCEGEIQYENFNAGDVLFEIEGVNVHPGSSKDIMVNAGLVAMEINSLLPKGNTPRDTDDYEGFYHLLSMEGNVAHAELHYIVRDHDAAKYEERLSLLKDITEKLNDKWGEGTVKLTYKESYRNMAEIIESHPQLIEYAKQACRQADVEPLVIPIRGGTDGARLSYMGLPCPNLGTGGYGFHGPYEHNTIEGMDLSTDIAVELVKIFASAQ